MLGEHVRQAIGVAEIGDHELAGVEHGPTVESQLQRVQRGLVAVDHDQRVGGEAGDLVAQLAADRAAGAGDEDPAAAQVAGDGIDVGVDHVATEQVGVVERADVAETDRSAEELGDGGKHQDLEVGGAPEVAQLAEQLGAGAGHGQDERRRVVLRRGLDEVVTPTHHPHAAQAQVPLGRIVVDHGDGQVRALGVAQHGGDGLDAALAGPEDQGPAHAVAARAHLALKGEPPRVARAAHQDEGDDPPGDGDAGRHEQRVVQQVDRGEGGGGDGHRLDQMRDLVEGAELPATEIEAEAEAGDGLTARCDHDGGHEAGHVEGVPPGGDEAVEAQHHGHVEAEGPGQQVERQLDGHAVALKHTSDPGEPRPALRGIGSPHGLDGTPRMGGRRSARVPPTVSDPGYCTAFR